MSCLCCRFASAIANTENGFPRSVIENLGTVLMPTFGAWIADCREDLALTGLEGVADHRHGWWSFLDKIKRCRVGAVLHGRLAECVHQLRTLIRSTF